MTTEQIRIAIAEKCEYKDIRTSGPYKKLIGEIVEGDRFYIDDIPNYPSSLDAMHEAERVCISPTHQREYVCNLIGVVSGDMSCSFGPDGEIEGDEYKIFTATASQRAEAFLRTFGLWKE